MSVTVYPKGTTLYKPGKCFHGYTIFSLPIKGNQGGVFLIDGNGKIVHEWKLDSSNIKAWLVPRAKLLNNGHVIVVRGHMMSKDGGIQEYDWDGRLVWEYSPPLGYFGPHHDVFRKTSGNTLLICREEVPKKYREKAEDPRRRDLLYSDVILEVTPDKKIIWDWHEYEYLNINRCNKIVALSDWWRWPNTIPHNNTITDWTHTNTVQALPKNKWHDEGDERFKPGNILVSLRQLDLILLVDRDTKRMVWDYTGDYKGGLSGQHESYMIEKGMPGSGNILIFDNGASPYKDLVHTGCSFVLEVNPISKKVVWKYENAEKFHSTFTCSSQRLPNGNTLINETAGGRIFEMTAEGEIVWEYVHMKGKSTRAYRHSYDYCPQTNALEKPDEIPVIPSGDMEISSAQILLE